MANSYAETLQRRAQGQGNAQLKKRDTNKHKHEDTSETDGGTSSSAQSHHSPNATKLGKRELITWASERTGIVLKRIDDLRDGSALHALFALTFPTSTQRHAHAATTASSWTIIRLVSQELGLPSAGINLHAIRNGNATAVYNCLAMLHFLQSLAQQHTHSAVYTSMLDQSLTTFLQSQAAVDALAKGGALSSGVRFATSAVASTHSSSIENKTEQQTCHTTEQHSVSASPISPEGTTSLRAPSDEGTQHWTLSTVVDTSNTGDASCSNDNVDDADDTRASADYTSSKPTNLSVDVSSEPTAQQHRKPVLKNKHGGTSKAVKFAHEAEHSQPPTQMTTTNDKTPHQQRGNPTASLENSDLELRYQNDGLRRVLAAAREERELLINRYEYKIKELEVHHQAELASRLEAERNAASKTYLEVTHSRSHDQKRYIAELERLMKNRSYDEAQQAKQDATDELVAQLQRERDQLREQVEAEREHAAALRSRFGIDYCDGDSSPTEACDRNTAQVVEQPTRRERELQSEVEDLKRILQQKDASHLRQLEESRVNTSVRENEESQGMQTIDAPKASNHTDVQEPFQLALAHVAEQNSTNELMMQVERLQASNRYLRKLVKNSAQTTEQHPDEQLAQEDGNERNAIADSDDDISSPTAGLWQFEQDASETGDPYSNADRAAAEIYTCMIRQDRTDEALERAQKALWCLVASHAILSERIKVQDEKLKHCKQESANESIILSGGNKTRSSSNANMSRKEQAQQSVRATLAERKAEEATEEARRAHEALVDARKESAMSATQSFESLSQTLQQSREDVSMLRLREEHWMALLKAHEKTIQLLDASASLSNEDEQKRGELEEEAEAECDAIDAIKCSVQQSELSNQAINDAVSSARRELDAQLKAADKLRQELQEKTQNASALAARVRELEQKLKESNEQLQAQEKENDRLKQQAEGAEAKLREQKSALHTLRDLSATVSP